jgi:hypothetical protein
MANPGITVKEIMDLRDLGRALEAQQEARVKSTAIADAAIEEGADVGDWRYCPHCARPLVEPEYTSIDGIAFDLEDMVCSCCRRPWIACPCTPAEEGACRAER